MRSFIKTIIKERIKKLVPRFFLKKNLIKKKSASQEEGIFQAILPLAPIRNNISKTDTHHNKILEIKDYLTSTINIPINLIDHVLQFLISHNCLHLDHHLIAMIANEICYSINNSTAEISR